MTDGPLARYGRLELRPAVLADGPALLAMWDAEACRWNGWGEEQVRSLELVVADPAALAERGELVAQRWSDGVIVGSVSMAVAEWDAGRASFGCCISPQLRGQGYGAELVGVAATFARRCGVQWLDAGTSSDNMAMRRALERIGAVQVRSGPHTLPNGETVEGCWYALALSVRTVDPRHAPTAGGSPS
ncbi:MAG: GNAT family N-acetyltransferase [Actinomycetota bacterium]